MVGVVVSVWSSVLSDLCTDLAAAWLGSVLVVPAVSKELKPGSFWILTTNLVFGIVFLIFGFEFRKLSGL